MIDKEAKMDTLDDEKIKSEEDDIDIAKEIYLQEMHASKEFIKILEKMDKRKREKLQMQAVYDMLKKQHQWNIFMLIYAIVMTLIVVSIISFGLLHGYIVIG